MTVDKVQPCVCSIENFEEEQRNDINYGMPVLLVHNSIYPYKQFWTTRCPKCGRGGLTEYDSAYKAIRAWNQLQAVLYMSDSPWEPTKEES